MDTLDLKIYKIQRMGYFSRKADVPQLNDIGDIISNMKRWITGQRTIDNCTYTDNDAPGSDKTLCVSIIKDPATNDFLLTMWAGIDVGDKNAVGAIKASSNPDDVQVEENVFEPGAVPGYPIYFYVMPSHSVLTPVKINGSKNGIISMARYMNGFLQRYSKYVNYTTDEDGSRNVSHFGKSGDADNGYYPMFRYRNWQKADMAAFLHEKRELITRVVKKELVVRSRDGGILQRLFHFSSQNDDRLTGVKFKYELDITPTETELRRYLEECDNGRSDDCDYGFKIGADIHWVGHSIQKHRFSARLRRRGAVLHAGQTILDLLVSNRQQIINELTEVDDDQDGDDSSDSEDSHD